MIAQCKIVRMKKTRRALMGASAAAVFAGGPLDAQADPPIQLHTDLAVKPQSETQLYADFEKLFLPRIRKAPGFVEAKLLRFRRANVGAAPERYNHRLVQVFTTEELREKWTVHPDHKVAWHEAIEKHVETPFAAYLYDIKGRS
jgi:heme-degrading monooxygenase HmoA